MEAKIPEKSQPPSLVWPRRSCSISRKTTLQGDGAGLNGMGHFGNGGIKCQPPNERQEYFCDPQGKTGAHDGSFIRNAAPPRRTSSSAGE